MKTPLSAAISFSVNEVKYDFSIPSSMSDIDLIIKETYQKEKGEEISESETRLVFDALARLSQKLALSQGLEP